MAKKHKVWIGDAPTHRSFRPYVVAIGEAAVAWNGLHEAFRRLFTTIGNDDFPSSAAMWYSLRSDRAQRQLIREYNGDLQVHNSLLNVILHDNPQLRRTEE
jgi:hypothetical protein